MTVSGDELRTIQEMIESVRYGTICVIIQDGKIVQIEKNEKIRFTKK